MIFKLAWRNLWRNRSRTLITMMSVFFAVLLAVLIASLSEGIYGKLIKNAVNFYTGYIQIHKKNYWDERILDNTIIYTPKKFSSLESDPEIMNLSPRLESFMLASFNDKTKGCFVAGVVPEKEAETISLKDRLTEGNFINSSDKEVLITDGLSAKLHAKLHDTIVLLGQGYHGATAAGKYAIKGVVKFSSADINENFIFMPLKQAQYLFSADSIITSLVVAPKNTNDLRELQAKLKDRLGDDYDVHTWQEILPGLDQHVRMCTADAYIFIGVLYVLISFGIFGTLLMMLAEREKEFRMMVTIGMKRAQLGIIVLTESIFITLTGCVIGALVGFPMTYYFKIHPIPLSGKYGEAYYSLLGFEPDLVASTNPQIIFNQAEAVLGIALILSLYPLIRILRLTPEKASIK